MTLESNNHETNIYRRIKQKEFLFWKTWKYDTEALKLTGSVGAGSAVIL